jgi:hypothetical protein
MFATQIEVANGTILFQKNVQLVPSCTLQVMEEILNHLSFPTTSTAFRRADTLSVAAKNSLF